MEGKIGSPGHDDSTMRGPERAKEDAQSGGGLPVGMDLLVFELVDTVIPSGTDFSTPMELGTFSLSIRQMILGGHQSMDYDRGGLDNESMFMFVAPTVRKSPAASGYFYTGPTSSSNWSSEAFGRFDLFHVVSSNESLFNDDVEREALAPTGTDAEVEFGVYLSPLTDSDPGPTSYTSITVACARTTILILGTNP